MKYNQSKFNPGRIEEFYVIHEELGKGSFSVVKRCTEITSNKDWAVKIIDKEKVKNRQEIVQVEIDVLSSVSHPNTLKEIFETATQYFLVIELITGGELFDKIIQLQSYSESNARQIIVQLVNAIDHLHQHNVIHRDLKPENLLLSDSSADASIKLADFGLSAIVDSGTQLRLAVGTPGYIAPDVLRTLDDDFCVYGKEVDLWAVGVILYILLCGFPPFFSDDDDEMFDFILDGTFSFPSPYWDAISEEAKDLITHLLLGDPSLRYTPQQVLAHSWITKEPATEHLPSAIEELRKFNARRKWKGAIMATMLTVSKLKLKTKK